MQEFPCRVLAEDDAAEWRQLRLEGTRDFPMGFLLTHEEAAAASFERCQQILSAGTTLGVFAAGKLVGFCGFRPQVLQRTRHRAEIGPFFVTRSHQGSGAANAMIEEVIDTARQQGISQIELYVDTENLRALAFYERRGFRIMATLKDSVRIDGQPRQDHFMTLKLT